MPKGIDRIDPRVLGARLQDASRACGLTQQQVAKELRVARTTIVAMEKGERKTSPSELITLAKLYRRQMSELVGREQVTESFIPQFRSTERQTLAISAEYEKSAYELQRLSEDYAELESMLRVHRHWQYPPVYETFGASPEDIGRRLRELSGTVWASVTDRLGTCESVWSRISDCGSSTSRCPRSWLVCSRTTKIWGPALESTRITPLNEGDGR